MDKPDELAAVLGPVTSFLEEALRQVVSSHVLSETTMPLIRAIEAVPGAGRVAVFLTRGPDSGSGSGARDEPGLVSGPSFDTSELRALAGLVAEQASPADLEPGRRPRDFLLPLDGGPPNRVRLFPLQIPGERPAAILLTVRDPLDDDAQTVFDSFMDQIVQIAGVVVEDRRLRSKMAEQQSVLEALIAAAPDAIVRIDAGGTILDFMGSAPHLFGWHPGEVIGQPVTVLMPSPHAERHDDYITAFLSTGERQLPDFGRRLQARHRSGRLFPVEVALSQLPGHDTAEFIGIIRDITARVARETELDAMREALDMAGRQSALGELAATIAHELNQPLTAIANYMDALELRLDEPVPDNLATARELARKAGAQARLGAQIIRRTRRMARTGEPELRMDDFHAAIAEAVSLVRKMPAARNVAIRHVTEGPSTPAAFDRVQLQQVVINLASNALEAMRAVDAPQLTLVSRRRPAALDLIVRDNGPGVPDADKAKVFERFYRRSGNGMGLGLAIVQRIAHAHGGTVRVADGPGGGAEFTLTLPGRVI